MQQAAIRDNRVRRLLERCAGAEVRALEARPRRRAEPPQRRGVSALAVPEGGRAVDVGCGFGDTAIELAKRVGPAGYVLGIDCCDGFLDYGRRDAAAAGLGNVEFLEADVQSYPFAGDFDLCFSRFGTQFFENPVAALRNMRRSLKPGRRDGDDRLADDRRQSVARGAEGGGAGVPAAAGRGRADLRAGAVLDGRSGDGDEAAGDRRVSRHRLRADRRAGAGREQPGRRGRVPDGARAGRARSCARRASSPSGSGRRSRRR